MTIKKQTMRKLVAAINMTLDGSCDHTAGIPDEEIHQHYTDRLNNAGAILYGRITYQLMEYWRPLVEYTCAKSLIMRIFIAFATLVGRKEFLLDWHKNCL